MNATRRYTANSSRAGSDKLTVIVVPTPRGNREANTPPDRATENTERDTPNPRNTGAERSTTPEPEPAEPKPPEPEQARRDPQTPNT